MELFQNTNFWMWVSFAIFAFVFWRYGKDAVLRALDNKIESIRKDLQTAETLRVESQELLAQYQRKQRDALKEAESIIRNAEKSAADYKKKAQAEMEEMIERRERQLQERLGRMKLEAKEEIQNYAAELAIDATRHIISENLDKETNQKLLKEATVNFKKSFH